MDKQWEMQTMGNNTLTETQRKWHTMVNKEWETTDSTNDIQL